MCNRDGVLNCDTTIICTLLITIGEKACIAKTNIVTADLYFPLLLRDIESYRGDETFLYITLQRALLDKCPIEKRRVNYVCVAQQQLLAT